MKLTQNQLSIIDEYIDETLIDKARLIQYLEKHRTIKNDIFVHCSRLGRKHRFGEEAYCGLLDDGSAFHPVDRNTFIRRIPFYFYLQTKDDGTKGTSGLWNILPNRSKQNTSAWLEEVYQNLEWLYYDIELPLEVIFGYCSDQVARIRKVKPRSKEEWFLLPDYSDDEMYGVEGEMTCRDLYPMWFHYIRLCTELGWDEYTPERFTAKYNQAREEAGLQPIRYKPLLQYGAQYFVRAGDSYICKGHFPRDDDGTPILRWTTIRVSNPKKISFTGNKSQSSTLEIELSPSTTIHLHGYDNYADDEDEADDEWHQIYAGPLNMEFNYEALRDYRYDCGMTQKEVADAIGANVRTYQKWESGESVPDGHFLLRLMNWLQIDNVQELIAYRKPDTQDH